MDRLPVWWVNAAKHVSRSSHSDGPPAKARNLTNNFHVGYNGTSSAAVSNDEHGATVGDTEASDSGHEGNRMFNRKGLEQAANRIQEELIQEQELAKKLKDNAEVEARNNGNAQFSEESEEE